MSFHILHEDTDGAVVVIVFSCFIPAKPLNRVVGASSSWPGGAVRVLRVPRPFLREQF
jgi:hypothetical protein